MSDESLFNIENEIYTPPPENFALDMQVYTPPSSGYETDFNIDLAAYTPPPESSYSVSNNTGSLSGWVNSVANLLPSVVKGISGIFGGKQGVSSTPLPNTYSLGSTPVQNGLAPSAKSSGSGLSIGAQQGSSNMLIYIALGALALFILLPSLMRK